MNIRHNPQLLADLYNVFNTADPHGFIKMGAPPDEYDCEIATVIERIGELKDIESTRRVLHEEFVRWFDERIAGTPDVYSRLAVDLFNFLRDEGLI